MNFSLPGRPGSEIGLSRIALIVWLLLSSIFLSSCSPIVIDAMPCVGMVYFQTNLNDRFSLLNPGRVNVAADWLGWRANDPSYLLVEGLYGENLEKAAEAKSGGYGELLYQLHVERGSVPPVYQDQFCGTAFLLPLFILTDDTVTPIEYTGFSVSQLDRTMDQMPLAAIQLTTIRTDQGFWGSGEYLHLSSDMIVLEPRRSWELSLKETDPCARPARFVPFSRFRKRVTVY